jgi:Putative zinc-finger
MPEFGEPIMPLGGPLSFADDEDPYALWDGAYVLGALSAVERREYEEHLGSCAPCRHAVSELSGAPALLARLEAAEVAALDESGRVAHAESPMPPALLTSVIAEATRRQHRTRLFNFTVTAAAVGVLVTGTYLVWQSHSAIPSAALQQAATSALTMTRVTPNAVTATVSLTGHEWGTGIEMTCVYAALPGNAARAADNAASESLAMVVVGRDGRSMQLASWVGMAGVSASPRGSTSTPIAQIAAVRVVSTDTGNVLLQRDL